MTLCAGVQPFFLTIHPHLNMMSAAIIFHVREACSTVRAADSLTLCTDGGRTEVSLCSTCSPCRPRLCGRLKSKRAGKELSSLVHFTAVTSADRAMDHLCLHLSHRPLVEQFGRGGILFEEVQL